MTVCKAEIRVGLPLPKLEYQTWKGIVRFEKDRIVIEGAFSEEDIEEFNTALEEAIKKFLPNALATPLVLSLERERMRLDFLEAYSTVDEALLEILRKCEIRVYPQERRVVVNARDLPYSDAARLVGKNGRNVKAAEDVVGLRICILGPQRGDEK